MKHNQSCSFFVSNVEVYNEKIRDLLNDNAEGENNILEIRLDQKGTLIKPHSKPNTRRMCLFAKLRKSAMRIGFGYHPRDGTGTIE